VDASASLTYNRPAVPRGPIRTRPAGTGIELQFQVRARWYDSRLGRFMSEDPIGLAGGINPDAYADNSPTNLKDPSGLCSFDKETQLQVTVREIPAVEVVGRRDVALRRCFAVCGGPEAPECGVVVRRQAARGPSGSPITLLPLSRRQRDIVR
jgi:RHS repeat-associated protein